jgi:2-polyprenyl-3-methyl-5-hydroxy-6-metoxy-1,4-benzoquinol methylase
MMKKYYRKLTGLEEIKKWIAGLLNELREELGHLSEVVTKTQEDVARSADQVREAFARSEFEVRQDVARSADQVREAFARSEFEVRQDVARSADQVREAHAQSGVEVRQDIARSAVQIREDIATTGIQMRQGLGQVAEATLKAREDVAQSAVQVRQDVARSASQVREDITQTKNEVKEVLGNMFIELSLLQGEMGYFRRFLQYTRSLQAPDLEYERIEPGNSEQRILFMRHLAAYRYAYQQVRIGNYVVDVGCGEGYGPYLLAARAGEVVGYDVSELPLNAARKKYCPFADNLSFKIFDGVTIPEADERCDLVTCFQTIEHVSDPKGLLTEIKRILKPQGRLVISTPNKATFSPDGELHPFHLREYTVGEFNSFLEESFSVEQLFGLHSNLMLALRDDLLGSDYGIRGKKIREFVRGLPVSAQGKFWEILLEESAYFSIEMADTGWFLLNRNQLDESLDFVALCSLSR